MDIFQSHNPELAQSKIEVMREGNSMVVIFTSKNDPTNIQKTFGVRLEPKEELSTQELNILRSHMDQTQFLDEIQGSNFILIQKATEIFRQYNIDLMFYNIEIVHDNDSVIVIFTDKNRSTDTLGSVGKSGFEVKLNSQDLTVIRSHFVR